MTETTPQDRIPLKNRTKVIHAGRRPSDQYGFVNTPVYRGSTVLFPNSGGFFGAQCTVLLRHPGNADNGVAGERVDGTVRRRWNRARAFGPRRDHARPVSRR